MMLQQTFVNINNASNNHVPSPASENIANINPHGTQQSIVTNSSHILLNQIISNSSNNTNQSSSTMNQDDLWWELPRVDNFVDLFSILCSVAVIFGGLIPYIPQYVKIKRLMNSDGFSTYVCLTLLIANILRIMFWFGHRFETPLLIQSFVMIVGMLAMMEICVRVKDKRSTYTISAIGFGTNNQRNRSRRLLNNGKRNRDGTNNESSPIYSVLSSSSSSSSSSQQYTNSNNYQTANSEISYHRSLQPDIVVRGENTTSGNSLSSYDIVSISSGTNGVSYNGEFLVMSQSSSSNLVFQEQGQQQQQLHRNLKWLLRSINQAIKCFDAKNFWNWDDYWSYIRFLLIFTLIISLTTYLLLDKYLYVEILGYVAVFTESMLGMPQLMRNYTKKSTLGMSVEMVIMWLSGDLFKTLYFIIRRAPAQFYVCGSIQVVVDILILYQVLWYRRPNVTYRKLPESS